MMNLVLRLVIILLTLILATSSTPAVMPVEVGAMSHQAPTRAPSFGLNSHLATRYPDPASMDVPARLLNELGVTWVREDFHWHRIQPRPDLWDWTFTDEAMRILRDHQIEVVGVFGPSVGWATPQLDDGFSDVSYAAPDPDAFLVYAREVVIRYKAYVHYWEIWNEPDHPYFWQPKPDVVAYTQLLIRTAAMIRELDPGATLLLGGINPHDTNFLSGVAHYGGWNSFDILAIHPYVDPKSPEQGNLAAVMATIRLIAHRYGAKPIWVTEVGWASGVSDRDAVGYGNPQSQADYLVRAMLLFWHVGVEKIFWYTLKDDPGNAYGLVAEGRGRSDFRRHLLKPAFFALRSLNQQIAGATAISRYEYASPQTIIGMVSLAGWRRMHQPNGSLQVDGATQSIKVAYNFTTRANDYLVFEREEPLPLPQQVHAIGAWIRGDGSTHRLKVWLRDAQGELLQFTLGPLGSSERHLVRTMLSGMVEPGDLIEAVPGGNQRLDAPAQLEAILVDDGEDRFVGEGSVVIEDLHVVSGPELYHLQVTRGTHDLEILWSPSGACLQLDPSSEHPCTSLGPTPIYRLSEGSIMIPVCRGDPCGHPWGASGCCRARVAPGNIGTTGLSICGACSYKEEV